ncbi:hypothetical protein ACQ4M3_12925 [Leptolyngbya sp. AN03gr2]
MVLSPEALDPDNVLDNIGGIPLNQTAVLPQSKPSSKSSESSQ